jgi:hypothetical protein
MTKIELVAKIADKAKLAKVQAEAAVIKYQLTTCTL